MVDTSLTPARLLQILNDNEDSTYSTTPPLLSSASKLSTHASYPKLLPGEQILLQLNVTCVETYHCPVEGILHLSTYRVIFSGVMQHLEDDQDLLSKKAISQYGKKKSISGTLDRIREKSKSQSIKRRSIKSQHMTKPMEDSQRGKNGVIQNKIDDKNENGSLIPMNSAFDIDQENKDTPPQKIFLSIPCKNIYDVMKLSRTSVTNKDPRLLDLTDGIELLCCTLQIYKFLLSIESDYNADKLVKIFSKYTKDLLPSKSFAMTYKEAVYKVQTCDMFNSRKTRNFYHFEDEFDRLGLRSLDCWREYSPTDHLKLKAPKKTLIPHGVNDVEMNKIIEFHRNCSFPSISWRNTIEGTVLLRSGSALYERGCIETRCEEDENFLALVCFQNKQSSRNKLVVFTQQNNENASGLLAQQLSGQITPKQLKAFYYPHVKFVYTDELIIPDHKTVKQSSYRLQTLLAAEGDDKFLSGLAETQWLSQISELLETTSLIITALSNGKHSVLISYEFGCDRTSQLSSLSQLLLDPYYRTIDGFQILIQKEWISFGHQFCERCISKSNEGHGPIFLQWLDCVWQLLIQFPISFEFNELFLQTIAEHAYSCRFGTFLCDSELQFEEEKIDSKTMSLWTWINLTLMAEPEIYLNRNYMKTNTERVLFPRYHIASLKVWDSYYAKSRLEANLLEAKHMAKEQCKLQEDLFANMLGKHQDLQEKIQSKNDCSNSESSAEYDMGALVTSESKEDLVNDVAERFELKTGSLKPKGSKRLTSIRSRESKSLEDLLQTRRHNTSSIIKRRFGSSKFYVDKSTRRTLCGPVLAETENSELDGDKGDATIFNGIEDYLQSKGVQWKIEKEITVTQTSCSGVLIKRGNVRKNWLPRWFKYDLRKNYIAYFENYADKTPKGVIECNKIRDVYSRDKKGTLDGHKFYVVTDERTFALKARTESLMNIWIIILSIKSDNFNIR
ncbi:myotubularin-like [Xenia sp. Carnegie-2017]|uniref:myotubularin-like n=1 Tax=Xenia sp. Carnegie-2017 TaxID=2897299 RepID=UPI001F04F417|nr:myotubularin-like [Xenia sp. Carnegie-2017]XP_046848931.1 myotubularin-like [Xenia sp. Carnegie-2017]XP_046848932.1 myotubularin-like [Xenia sp. Carnegie-2017]XP_046848933.1 myotubularin-like [Xenia sp. Carnegie-2017]